MRWTGALRTEAQWVFIAGRQAETSLAGVNLVIGMKVGKPSLNGVPDKIMNKGRSPQ